MTMLQRLSSSLHISTDRMNVSSVQTTQTYSFSAVNSTEIIRNQSNCVVWEKPSRIILEIITLITLFLNVLACVVVFRVHTDVRGRHVAFLFSCVRILNILDILQCLILLVGPVAMPASCNPDQDLCSFLGFLFTATALFSPLTAIVMAVDRAIAVYFHLLYKSNPYLKLKFSFLSFLFVTNGFYLLLPCFTEFSAYVPVPWLALCFLEWGMTYRLYDLILSVYTAVLIFILIAANIAIVAKIRNRKHQVQKIRRKNRSSATIHDTNHIDVKYTIGMDLDSPMLHRSADDVTHASHAVLKTFTSMSPPLTHRNKKMRPPSLVLSPDFDYGNHEHDRPRTPVSPLLSNANCTLLTTESNGVSKFSVTKRPASLFSPREAEGVAPFTSPLLRRSPQNPSISPLVVSPLLQRKSPMFNSMKQHVRSSSADDVLKTSGSQPSTPSRFSFHKPLLRQVLDYSNKPTNDNDSVKDSCRSSEEIDSLPRNHSTSSFFSLAPSTLFGGSLKLNKPFKKRILRKKVSRITKMTIAICLVFIVFYVPFLVRKLIQLVPDSYTTIYIPPAIETITLFGPFLSPLFNPIIYVFLNPHYKKSFKQLCRKITKCLPRCYCKNKAENHTKKKQVIPLSTKQPSSLHNGNEEIEEDVFLPPNNHMYPDHSSNNEFAENLFENRRLRSDVTSLG